MKRIMSLFLCIVMVLPFCVSCKKEEVANKKVYTDRLVYNSLEEAMMGYYNTPILGKVKGKGKKVNVDVSVNKENRGWSHGYVDPIEIEVIKSYNNKNIKPGDIITCIFPYKEAIPDLDESFKLEKNDYGVFFMLECPHKCTENIYPDDRRIYVYDEYGDMRLKLDENNNVTNTADLQNYLLKDINNLAQAEERINTAIKNIAGKTITPETIN